MPNKRKCSILFARIINTFKNIQILTKKNFSAFLVLFRFSRKSHFFTFSRGWYWYPILPSLLALIPPITTCPYSFYLPL